MRFVKEEYQLLPWEDTSAVDSSSNQPLNDSIDPNIRLMRYPLENKEEVVQVVDFTAPRNHAYTLLKQEGPSKYCVVFQAFADRLEWVRLDKNGFPIRLRMERYPWMEEPGLRAEYAFSSEAKSFRATHCTQPRMDPSGATVETGQVECPQ